MLLLLLMVSGPADAADVPSNRIFETSITNNTNYSNNFKDVTLNAVFTSPSGQQIPFWGFYDGHGNGTGHKTNGNVWKLRFMPDEVGTWTYTYNWSDGTAGGSGSFNTIGPGASPGVVQPYKHNKHWFAYNPTPLATNEGTAPVLFKSYYNRAHSSITQSIDWMGPNVYQRIIDGGYNHIQMAGLLPVAFMNDDNWMYRDGPNQIKKNLYATNGDPTTMNFDVWHEMERHMDYLNDRDILVQFFEGFDGRDAGGDGQGVRWGAMNNTEREWYVKYVVARLAPYANIAGWNFTWETGGGGPDKKLAEMLEQYDPWNHGRTYEDKKPSSHNYDKSVYTFAAIENAGVNGGDGRPISHHNAVLAVDEDKPVFMMEGRGLWRSFWRASEDEIIDNIWAVTTAGGSFTWNDLKSFNESEGARSTQIFSVYSNAAKAVDIFHNVMTNELQWYNMTDHDDLLSDQNTDTFALAELGRQYLVWENGGGSFTLDMQSGIYAGFWMNTHTGDKIIIEPFEAPGGHKSFVTPSNNDYILILKAVPEPTAMAMLGLGGLALMRRR